MTDLASAFLRSAATGPSPVHRGIARGVAGSAAAVDALAAAPARARRPPVVLAALHDLALAGRAPALAAALAAGDDEAAAAAAVGTLLGCTEEVCATALRRPLLGEETGRYAVLYPAVAEAAHRSGARAVGLVGVGRPAGLDLLLDRVGVSYAGQPPLGDPASAVQVSAVVVGDRSVPRRPVPPVLTRVVLDRDPVDVTDPGAARWVRACVPPDLPTTLDAELALAAADPPHLLRGDPVGLLGEAVARVPADALPVVVTAWALSRCTPERRTAFREQLDRVAAERAVAWVSVEGVGVAPGVPTLGDRRASGHSTVGLTVPGPSGPPAEVLGRCWSRGRTLSWLTGPVDR